MRNDYDNNGSFDNNDNKKIFKINQICLKSDMFTKETKNLYYLDLNLTERVKRKREK